MLPTAETRATIAFHTLGCKLNFSETSTLARRMVAAGFVQKPFDEAADVYVINTCSVTENADKECRMLVRRVRRKAPDAAVVITGCYAQLKPQEIAAIDGVDLVLGAAEKMQLADHLARLSPRGGEAEVHCNDVGLLNAFEETFSEGHRTRTFLKVQDGCDYGCSFCTIPMARGRSRSNTITSVMQRLENLEESGVKEVVLTGINLGDFGRNGAEAKEDFFGLLQAIEHGSGIPRFRISSIEPNLLIPAMVDFVADSRRIMPHFHIPLQSGSNQVLGLMRRRYRRELYADRVAQIKDRMPHCGIGVDVIVGFPGEDDEAFRETHDFLSALEVSYLHVFTYSERAGTLAVTMPGTVPQAVRNERNRALRTLSYLKSTAFADAHAGQERMVLWERSKQEDMLEGYTDNGIRVSGPAVDGRLGKIAPWRLS